MEVQIYSVIIREEHKGEDSKLLTVNLKGWWGNRRSLPGAGSHGAGLVR